MDKIVVLMKTHKWNPDIEKFAIKIRNESLPYGIHFFILLHTENDNLLEQIKDERIKDLVICITEKEIKKIYPAGFFGMWLSNHWLLMWFFRNFGAKYKYFWSVEYDVRIIGRSTDIWKCSETTDFIYPLGNYPSTTHFYGKTYVGGKLKDTDKYFGYLQLARYSYGALDYLNQCFESGENGQDELITFSLLRRGGFTMSKTFLQKLIRGTWTWHSKYIPKNKIIFEKSEQLEKYYSLLFIFHPIK